MKGLCRSGDFRNGTPITLPHQFGTPVAGENEPFGNVEPQSNPRMAGNPVDWSPSSAHLGNQVSFLLQTVPPIVIVAPGETGSTDINLTNLLGTSSAELTYFGEPSGVTLSFSPNPDTSSSTVTITVSSSVPVGKYTITVVGTVDTPDIEYVQLHLVVASEATGPAPTFTSITPNNGPTVGGTSFEIVGTNFISGATVSIGGSSATDVVVVDPEHITGVSPMGTAGETDVKITTSNGSVDTDDAWTYTASGPTYVIGTVAPTTAFASPAVTPSVDTTGANFLVAVVASYDYNATNTVSDTIGGSPSGNTWVSAGITQSGINAAFIYYCYNAVVGPEHVFQNAVSGGSGDATASIAVMAFSGMPATDPLETGTTKSTGINSSTFNIPVLGDHITPASAGDVVVVGVSLQVQNNSGDVTFTPGTTTADIQDWTIITQGLAAGYYIVPNTDDVNVTIGNVGVSASGTAAIACFSAE